MIVGRTPQIHCNDLGHGRPMIAIREVLSINTCNGPGGTCAGWITGNATARRLTVV